MLTYWYWCDGRSVGAVRSLCWRGVGAADSVGRDTTRGPHLTLLSAGGSGLSWADEVDWRSEGEAGGVDRRMCTLGGPVVTYGLTSGFTSADVSSTLHSSGARGSPLHGLSGSRLRVCSTSRNGRGGVTNGGAEQ